MAKKQKVDRDALEKGRPALDLMEATFNRKAHDRMFPKGRPEGGAGLEYDKLFPDGPPPMPDK